MRPPAGRTSGPGLHSPDAAHRHRHPLRDAPPRGRVRARARRGGRRRPVRRQAARRRARPQGAGRGAAGRRDRRGTWACRYRTSSSWSWTPRSRRRSRTRRSRSCSERSAGTNVGLDFLPGALAFAPAVGPAPEPELAAAVVWLDAFTTNVDRTPRNPNLIVWHRRLHLIDHGSALYIHHTWRDPAAHARRPFVPVRDHVLLPFAGSIVEADARLAPLLDRRAAGGAGRAHPGRLAAAPSPGCRTPTRIDARTWTTSSRGCGAPRAFVEEAERARAA